MYEGFSSTATIDKKGNDHFGTGLNGALASLTKKSGYIAARRRKPVTLNVLIYKLTVMI